jgi:PAS domain S-box-containing protein
MKPSQTHLDHFESECRELREQGFSIFGLHQDSIVMAATDDVERDFGYSIEEMLGMNAWKLFDVSSFTELTRHLSEKKDAAYQVVAVCKDGSRVSIYMNILQVFIDDESVRLVGYKLI